MFELRR